MGKKERMLQQAIDAMKAEIAALKNPANNPAQQYLTNEALAGAEFLKKGEYSSLPKGMFFDFQAPAANIDRYKKMVNVGQGGTFALGDNAGMGNAMATQKNYLSDKFARDEANNYQNNIREAAGTIRGALGGAAGAKSDNDARILQALQGMTGAIGQMPQSQSKLGSILGLIGGIGSSAITKW